MIDMHCHILPAVDDGSKSVSDSLKMAEEASAAGFSAVFATSHFIDEEYSKNKEDYGAAFKNLKIELCQKKISLDMYPGNEVFISPAMTGWIREKKFWPLNNTKYILMELPQLAQVLYLDNAIFEIIDMGFIPIIAHPEKYACVQEDINFVYELIRKGAFFQMNFASIIGHYGGQIKKTAISLLKHDMIHMFGSDAHRKNSIYTHMEPVMDALNRICGADRVKLLTETFPEKIIANQNVTAAEPVKRKKSFFRN